MKNNRFRIHQITGLIFAMFVTINLQAQTCDFSINNAAQGGDTEYFLELDAAGNIATVTAGPGPLNVTAVALGTVVEILHLVYDSANPPTNVPPSVGDDPTAIMGCTNDFLGNRVFLECLCVEDEIALTYAPGGGDTQVYFLIDPATGAILDSNTTGNFGADEAAGDYFVQVLAYDSASPPTTIPATGGNISDFSADGCYNSDFLTAACCSQKIACASMLVASDPCSCDNNQTANAAMDGTFSETITIEGSPGLAMCLASSSTGILNPSTTPNANGTIPLTETNVNATTSTYTVSFNHTDAVGYNTSFVDCVTTMPLLVDDMAGNPITNLNNVCYYPIIDFQPDDIICVNAGLIDLEVAMLTNDMPDGMTAFNGAFSFSGMGVTGTFFDPAAVGQGTYMVTATYTPGNSVGTNIDAADTVCTTSLTVLFEVTPCSEAGSF